MRSSQIPHPREKKNLPLGAHPSATLWIAAPPSDLAELVCDILFLAGKAPPTASCPDECARWHFWGAAPRKEVVV